MIHGGGWPPPGTDPQRSAADLPGLSPHTRAQLRRLEAAEPSFHTPEFTRLGENLFNMAICTSLDDAAALARVNAAPSGTSGGWLRLDESTVSCNEHPDTHRHVVFCVG